VPKHVSGLGDQRAGEQGPEGERCMADKGPDSEQGFVMALVLKERLHRAGSVEKDEHRRQTTELTYG
jgi:hypothetical protein